MARGLRVLVALILVAPALLTITLWVRSYWRIDGIARRSSSATNWSGDWYDLFSDHGRICFETIHQTQASTLAPPPPWFLENAQRDFAEDRYTPTMLPWWTYSVPRRMETFSTGPACPGYDYEPFYNRLVPRSWGQRWGIVSPPDCVVYIDSGTASFWSPEQGYYSMISPQGSSRKLALMGIRVYEGNRELPAFVSGRGYPNAQPTLHPGRLIVVPHAYFAIPSAILATLVLRHPIRQFRRRRAGQCLSCGYDLRATKDRCPECGTPIPNKAAPIS